MTNFAAGATVTVRVRNSRFSSRELYANGWNGPEIEEYTGTVVDVPHFNGDIGLTTGNSSFPIRRISRAAIVDMDNAPIDSLYPVESNTVTVEGSKGRTYVVTSTDGKVTCSCPGFSFRKSCKHIALV